MSGMDIGIISGNGVIDVHAIRAAATMTVMWAARRGQLAADWRGALRAEFLRPEESESTHGAPSTRQSLDVIVARMRATTEAVAGLVAVLQLTDPAQPVAAWEPGSGATWRAALGAWRTAAVVAHRDLARIARGTTRRAVRRSPTDPVVFAHCGFDVQGEKDRIELAWRLGHAAAGHPAGDDWQPWLAARLPRWQDRTVADAHHLALLDPDGPWWATDADPAGVYAAAGIGHGGLPAYWTVTPARPVKSCT